ncbi:MAG: NAD-dependent epimerase/dehydratase family protein [Bacteroidales bacterium]|nr:NAD-dependent epimerase/dehydratase family protein [Bacteroidales bacterium]MDY6000835.1 NAD-dependent epimerase/dehydratase family protein [Candidatus Cryptobacteroides sp.]
MKILVTGAAGFIGSALCRTLAERGDEVVGLDNINEYYDVALKYRRLEANGLRKPFIERDIVKSDEYANLRFVKIDLCDKEGIYSLFKEEGFDKVMNLAAQAGVRYSITNPFSYIKSNIEGFFNILEACRNFKVGHLVFASSSSIYGDQKEVPFREDFKTDSPVSLYAATKKSNELLAYSYAHLYGFSAIGLRYFTVYGPWGRPDMSPMLFATAISNGEPIKVFNNGNMMRDFTYISDIVSGTIKAIDYEPSKAVPNGAGFFKAYNIGCSNPVRLMDFISEIESALGKPAEKIFLPMQPGDVPQTYADTSALEHDLGYKPSVTLHEGIGRFIEWFKSDRNPLKP